MAVDFVVIIKVNQTTQEDLAPEPPTHTDVNEGRVLSNVDAPGREKRNRSKFHLSIFVVTHWPQK